MDYYCVPTQPLTSRASIKRLQFSNFEILRKSLSKVFIVFSDRWSRLLHKMVCLKDIVPAASNNVNAEFILLDKGSPTKEGQERTCVALVADETAAVHFQLWGSECDAFEAGDIIRLSNGIFSFHRNNLLLRAGKRGKAEKVGEFVKVFVETPNMSEIRWGPDPQNPKKLIQEAIISPHSRMFPPLP